MEGKVSGLTGLRPIISPYGGNDGRKGGFNKNSRPLGLRCEPGTPR